MYSPPTKCVTLDYSKDRDWFTENLRHEVFHVTPRQNFEKILESGAIHPSRDCRIELTFDASENSFFRNRGCISVFDLRRATDAQIKKKIDIFHPFRDEYGENPVLLILKSEAYAELVSWEACRQENALSEMVVPYIESGYTGSISMDQIEYCLLVTILNRPSYPNFPAVAEKMRP